MIARVLRHPAFVVAVAVGACWPVWIWYCDRVVRMSEHRAALIPLVLAVVLTFLRRVRGAASRSEAPVAAALGLYAAVFPFVPPLIRALFGVTVLGVALAAAAGRRGIRPGILLLLALALPAIPTAQFYLGFPLRALAGEISSWMLTLCGYDVVRSGAILDWGGRLVAVDAPCSGVRMLWSGLLVAAVIAAARDFGWAQTVLLAALAVVAVVAGNVIRTVALFFPEARIVDAPSWAHESVGLVCFGLMATLIIAVSHTRLISRAPRAPRPCTAV